MRRVDDRRSSEQYRDTGVGPVDLGHRTFNRRLLTGQGADDADGERPTVRAGFVGHRLYERFGRCVRPQLDHVEPSPAQQVGPNGHR